jgi:DNA helicase-2/ATP-dependent DNA helicase PcrA
VNLQPTLTGEAVQFPVKAMQAEGHILDVYASDEGRMLAEMGERLHRGSRVRHARFGEGEVRSVERSTELFVVAFFPGWGEKKILARYLEPG